MKKLLALCLMLCCYSVQSANALSVNVSDNVSDNTFISAGSTLNGTFNINSVIPSGGQYNQPYSISSATATFKFTDDLSDLSLSSPVTTTYTQYQKLNNDTYYRRYVTQWTLNANEQVHLNIDGQTSTDGTSWYETPLTNYGTQTLDSSTNNGTKNNPKWDYYFTQILIGEHGYSGTVTLTEVLGAAGLSDLSLDGLVPFTLSMLQGDMIYQSGNLIAEVNPNPPVTDPSAPVPEPGTIVLLGAGFFGLAVYGKRRKNA